MTTTSSPSTLASRIRLYTTSKSPRSFKINPEPSRNLFCQAREFGGLHVEIPNKQTGLLPCNYTQLTQSSIKQLLSQGKLLSISITTLIGIQNNQVHEPTSTQRQQTPNRPTTVEEALNRGSGKGRQRNRCTTSITNMEGILRSRCSNRGQPLTLKPDPLTPHPGRSTPASKANSS